MEALIQSKIKTIEKIFQLLKNTQTEELVDFLQQEITECKNLLSSYRERLGSKKVINKEDLMNKRRYYLEDGSTYVISSKCKYLYDAKSKIITYEFKNGQIERTFNSGIKEIRYPDGTICVKISEKDYDLLKL